MPIGAVVKLCDSGQIQVVDDEGNVSAVSYILKVFYVVGSLSDIPCIALLLTSAILLDFLNYETDLHAMSVPSRMGQKSSVYGMYAVSSWPNRVKTWWAMVQSLARLSGAFWGSVSCLRAL